MNRAIKIIGLAASMNLASWGHAETIDIGIMYDNTAAVSTSNIYTKINQLISFSNQVYKQNGIDITLRLAGTRNVGNHVIKPNQEWLDIVTNSTWVQGVRDEWKADMIAVLGTSETIGNPVLVSCGLGWLGSPSIGYLGVTSSKNMYSITAVDCGATTFVQELKHNM